MGLGPLKEGSRPKQPDVHIATPAPGWGGNGELASCLGKAVSQWKRETPRASNPVAAPSL